MVRPVNQCRTEIFRLPGELRRGPGVRVVAVAEHRDIDEVSRRGTLSDLGVDVRQIDPLINPAPDPVFADIGNFRRAIGCGHAIAVRSTRSWREMDSNLRYAGTVHPVSAAVVPLGCLGRVHVAATALMAGCPFKAQLRQSGARATSNTRTGAPCLMRWASGVSVTLDTRFQWLSRLEAVGRLRPLKALCAFEAARVT